MHYQLDKFAQVVSAFEFQSVHYSEHLAFQDERAVFTYQEFNNKANQVASCLKKKSIGPGDFVVLYGEPNADFIISILAILKVGAAYVPLDIQAPKSRLQEILKDAAPKLLMAAQKHLSLFQDNAIELYAMECLYSDAAHEEEKNLNITILPEFPCYMMYTSGSTGKPKGVIVPHRAVLNLAYDNALHIKPHDKMAQFSNIAFDGSTFEIWTSLLHAATLRLIPQTVRQDFQKLKYFLKDNCIQVMFLPTGYFHKLVHLHPETLDTVEKMMVGGEGINAHIVRDFIAYRRKKDKPILLVNGYGPTEATGHVCRQCMDSHTDMTDDYLSSIGQSIPHVKLYLLDKEFHEVEEGELYISGTSLALGYHRAAEGESKFIANPFEKEPPYDRLYKTGDKFKRLPTGELIYQGRLDDQVKIGGYRIHLTEIEQQLIAHEAVQHAVVTTELNHSKHCILVAYVRFMADKIIEAETLRHFLSQKLPPYMLPVQYRMIKEFPLTAIGKIDKKKIASLPYADLSFHIDSSLNSTLEEKLKDIWKTLLNRSHLDVHRNLFELGANSLLLIEACSHIKQTLQVDLTIADLFTYPSIHQLARYLEGDSIMAPIRASQQADSQDIAVVGMSCRFPKASNLEAYWARLCAGEDCLTRFEVESGIGVRGMLADIELFDANFFGFNAMEAAITDPQQRFFLECAWEALEDAAVAPGKTSDKVISVFAGMSDSTYLQENIMKNAEAAQSLDELQKRIATHYSMLSTQLSYRLNLKGKSLNVNTACSTGLIVIEEACQDLLAYKSDIALAGACSMVVPQHKAYEAQLGGILSQEGYCRPFSSKADGTVFSNGIGVVVLKRLQDAIDAGDRIYAVIKGRGVNNDGFDKVGFAAPSVSGQMACIRAAMQAAKVRPEEIGFLEAHGTATALGDMIEFNAISAVYREQTTKKQFCALGAVKANIGHTDVAAGMAGFIKAVLCLYYKKIPPLIHFSSANSNLEFESSPFFVNARLIEWASDFTRKVAVSSFGVGGTNAHFILSEPQKDKLVSKQVSSHAEIMLLSAKTEDALRQKIQQFSTYLKEGALPSLSDIAYTLQQGREDFSFRCFGVGTTAIEIAQHMEKNIIFSHEKDTHYSPIFLFSGQGTQYPGMALALFEKVPRFNQYVREGASYAKPYLKQDLIHFLQQADMQQITNTALAQPILLIIEIALAKLLIDCGIKPVAMMGHSLGEYVAACIAGIFSFKDVVAMVCERGILMATAPQGEMLAIEADRKTCVALQKIAEVDIALHHTETQYVLSGSCEAIAILEKYLTQKQYIYKKLHVSHAFHSRLMEPLTTAFQRIVSKVALSPPIIPIVSNVTGAWLTANDAVDPGYWGRHLRHTVQFYKGAKLLLKDKHPFFIEIGAGQSLCHFMKAISGGKAVTTHLLPSARQKTPEFNQFLCAVGALWQHGFAVDVNPLKEHIARRFVSVPIYPFQREKFWLDPTMERVKAKPQLFKPCWSRFKKIEAVSQPLISGVCHRTWLVFRDKNGFADAVIMLLKKHNAQIIAVNAHETNQQHDPALLQIELDSIQRCRHLFKTISSSLDNLVILYAPSYGESAPEKVSKKILKKHLSMSVCGLLHLSKAWVELKKDQPLSVIVLTSGMTKIIGTEEINPCNATLSAAQVMAQENRAFRFTVVDLNPEEQPQSNQDFVSELLSRALSVQRDKRFAVLIYRNGYQWAQTYVPIQAKKGKNLLKNKGVYLFTGGLGGIALACCEAILETVENPTFILFSRKELVAEKDWEAVLKNQNHPQHKEVLKLEGIKKLGAKIIAHKVDILNRRHLKACVYQYWKICGRINGVIHAAGIAKPELALMQSNENIQEVLSTKIEGTYNLAFALKNIPLDFIVLKSSLATILGGMELFDYCAANAGLEAFVDTNLFATDKMIAINWNTWSDVGMALHATSPNGQISTYGNAISSKVGKKIFLDILSVGEERVAVSTVDIEGALTQENHHQRLYQSNTQSPTKDEVHYPAEKHLDDLEIVIKKLWQNVLGLKEIGIHDNFFELGGHSLNALNLLRHINKTFKCTLSPIQLHKTPTIYSLKLAILNSGQGLAFQHSSRILVPMKVVSNALRNLFLCHPISGLIHCFNVFAEQCDWPISLYGLQDLSVEENQLSYISIHELAKSYLSVIKGVQPIGPYYLLGYSFGGTVMHEVAHLLLQEGQAVNLLVMIDSWAITEKNNHNKQTFRRQLGLLSDALSESMLALAWEREKLLLAHSPSCIKQEIVLFKSKKLIQGFQDIDDPYNGWKKYTSLNIKCFEIEGDHHTIMALNGIKEMLAILYSLLAEH